jgi:hypothetical protein
MHRKTLMGRDDMAFLRGRPARIKDEIGSEK